MIGIALLQGVNVGPKNAKKRIRMADLKRIMTDLGMTDVATYVNSGNAVFRSDNEDIPALEADLEERLAAHVGVDIPMVIRTRDDLREAIKANPFPDAVDEPKTLHINFLREAPARAWHDQLAGLDLGDDRIEVNCRDMYLFVPHNMSGISKGTQRALRLKGPLGTSRNWNTVLKLDAMAHDLND